MCWLWDWLSGYCADVTARTDRTVFVVPERIDVHVHIHGDNAPSEIITRLNQILSRLGVITQMEEMQMATVQDIQAAVADETTVVGSAVTLLDLIHQQLTDALASNDPAAVQAVLDNLASNRQALADAVSRNTDAAPTP